MQDALQGFRDHWTWRFVLRPLLVAYVLFFFFALFFSDALIYQNGPTHYSDSHDIIKLTTADGMRISARYLPNDNARYTILYSHGNGGGSGNSGGHRAETARSWLCGAVL